MIFKKLQRNKIISIGAILLGATALLLFSVIIKNNSSVAKNPNKPADTVEIAQKLEQLKRINPLEGKRLYNDQTRNVAVQYQAYATAKNPNATLLQKVSSQPGTTWLTGPTPSDPNASGDIATVARTSTEAAATGSVAVYQLYAIPKRDACAEFSSGGFSSGADYIAWVDRISATLKSEAIFSIEADAIPQTLRNTCLNASQIAERYTLLKQAVEKLNTNPKAIGIYLDAGHSEWFSDPAALVEPLKKSGVDTATGVAVNVSFFVSTPVITPWAQKLVFLLGNNKGVVIDSSRNGKGVPPSTVTGIARFCNPAGRGLGNQPTTVINDSNIDAYLWIKNVGESDGDCFGNPPAGVFEIDAALELARNAI